jgi:hypothetical protein
VAKIVTHHPETSPMTQPNQAPPDRREKLHLHLGARVLVALRRESVHRSATTGQPLFPAHIAAAVLAEWAEARLADRDAEQREAAHVTTHAAG